jgi:ribosome-associated toxin RatA of RatAB toxin-antitoxin module
MKTVHRNALVMHSAEQMYSLVNDIESYSKFLPWCGGSRILSCTSEEIVASLDIAKAGVKKTFTTRNRLVENQRVEMALVDGPFQCLAGSWSFSALSAEACKIELDLEFEFSGQLMAMILGPIFNEAANTMVAAFCKRADEIYGA